MANRTQTADLLKGIAAILMIQVHIIELFATHDISQSNIGKTLLFLGGPPVAPLFITLLGYFIAKSKSSASKLAGRGLKIILLGLLLNIALNFNLILSVNKGIYDVDIYHYIFGVDILPLAGLSIICIALLKKAFDRNIILVIPLIIISAFLGNFLLQLPVEHPVLKYVFSLFYGASTWSYFPLFPWLSYSLAGFTAFKITQKVHSKTPQGRENQHTTANTDDSAADSPTFQGSKDLMTKIRWCSSALGKWAGPLLGVSFLMFLTLTIEYAITTSSDLPAYYHHGLFFFLWVISFLFFYSFFINEIEKKLRSTFLVVYLKWLGKNITIVYIIQWIIIGNVATEIYKTVSDPWYLLIWFLAVLVTSSGICYSWIKLKKLNLKKFNN